MSRRRRVEPPEASDEDEDDDEEADDEDVEYFVDPVLEDSVRTSVPNSVQSSHNCSSAPSTFVVVSDDLSAPHISHWGMQRRWPPPRIKRAPTSRSPDPSATSGRVRV
jgi:hypothetical protein